MIETNGMYNWTDDIPTDSKSIFLNILSMFKLYEEPKILEIGTFVGKSIISMLDYLPKAKACVIDTWSLSKDECAYENDIRETFFKNIEEGKVKDRITVCEGPSSFYLRKFLRNNEKYDFIYVDGSHLCLDCHLDLVFSWELLNKNGILAIDDYMWKNEISLNSCKPAIDHFLENYKDEYTILNKGYRVFLYKN